jgi:hypothetical protein
MIPPCDPSRGWRFPPRLGSGEYLLDVFRRGLGESGYVEGQNVTIDRRLAAGRFDRFPEMAADLVQRRVSVIAAFGSGAARWGGRFSLIAPCLNGRIAPSYWRWLEAYDPDIVYSHVPLSRLTFWRCTSGFLPPNTPSTSWTANRGSTCSASNRPTDLRHFRGLGRLTTWIANSLVCNVCVCLSRLRIEAGWSFR